MSKQNDRTWVSIVPNNDYYDLCVMIRSVCRAPASLFEQYQLLEFLQWDNYFKLNSSAEEKETLENELNDIIRYVSRFFVNDKTIELNAELMINKFNEVKNKMDKYDKDNILGLGQGISWSELNLIMKDDQREEPVNPPDDCDYDSRY